MATPFHIPKLTGPAQAGSVSVPTGADPAVSLDAVGPADTSDARSSMASDVSGGRASDGVSPSPSLARPAGNAPKVDWALYAESVGVDTFGMTKADIINAVNEQG